MTAPLNYTNLQQFLKVPCEGARSVTDILDFTISAEVVVDLSTLQAGPTALFSGFETLYIDNSQNGSSVLMECEATKQTLTIPPNSCAYLNPLVSNPPKFKFTSAGNVRVRVQYLNYFLPPIIWAPNVAGGAGGLLRVAPTNLSGTIAVGGTPQILQAANPLRSYLLIHNPSTATEILQFRIGGGGWIDLTAGATYESTSPVITSLIEVVAATIAHAFTAYVA